MTDSARRFLNIGAVARPHGIAGEIKVQLAPEYAGVLEGVHRVYLDAEHPRRVLAYRAQPPSAVFLRLEGITSRNEAEALRGARVAIRYEDLPELPPGAYYTHQLVGMHVYRDTGELLGELTEVLRTGSNDVYVVKTDSGELLLPALESVVREVDVQDRVMRVVVPAGLE